MASPSSESPVVFVVTSTVGIERRRRLTRWGVGVVAVALAWFAGVLQPDLPSPFDHPSSVARDVVATHSLAPARLDARTVSTPR